MKLALIYIATAIFIYVVVDTILYLLSKDGPRVLFNLVRYVFSSKEPEEALTRAKKLQKAIADWMEKERKLEYKSVWLGNRLASDLEDLAKLWRGSWPDDFVNEIQAMAATLRSYYPRYVWTLFKAVTIAILLALFIRAFMVQAFKIPSGSMIPTLYVGDQLLVNKFKYGIEIPFTERKLIKLWAPKRGDVVVFKPPRGVDSSWQTHTIRIPFTNRIIYRWESQVDFIKRIVGLPGDKIEVKDGILYVNDEEMPIRPLKEFDYKKKYGDHVTTIESEVYEETIGDNTHLVIHDSPERMAGDNFGPYIVGPEEFFAMGDNRDDSQDARSWTATGEAARLEDIRGKAFIIHFSWDGIRGRPRFGRVGKLIH